MHGSVSALDLKIHNEPEKVGSETTLVVEDGGKIYIVPMQLRLCLGCGMRPDGYGCVKM